MFTAMILTVGLICSVLCACFLAITVFEMRKIGRRSTAAASPDNIIPLPTALTRSS